MNVGTPVVLIIYKRNKPLIRLLKVLKKVKPVTLYIIADGPKSDREKTLTELARNTVEEGISWKCKVNKFYSDKNMGLRKRIVSGLDKVFQSEDRAIILEDDCVPDVSFFRYCDQMLEKYKDEEKVMSISGDNFSNIKTNDSYYFSKYFHSWGWATWKRAWDMYDDQMTGWPKLKKNKWLNNILSGKLSIYYWTQIFDRVYKGKINSWAYRWSYTHFVSNGLSIVPSVNLVENIGINRSGTNTKIKSKTTNQKACPLPFPLSHPRKMLENKRVDMITEKNIYSNYRNLLVQFMRGLIKI